MHRLHVYIIILPMIGAMLYASYIGYVTVYANVTALGELGRGQIQNGSIFTLSSGYGFACLSVKEKGVEVVPYEECIATMSQERLSDTPGVAPSGCPADASGIASRCLIDIPMSSVRGVYNISLFAFRFRDVPTTPTSLFRLESNMRRHVLQYFYQMSEGNFILRLVHVAGWGDLPRTKSEYCNSPSYFNDIVVDALNRAFDLWRVRVSNDSFVVIYLNDICKPNVLGDATTGFATFNLKYGPRRIGVSIIYHFSYYAPNAISLFARNIGFNLGLLPSGVSDEFMYENAFDLMSNTEFVNSFDGETYLFPPPMSAYHRFFLGWLYDFTFIQLARGQNFTLGCRDGPYSGYPRLAFARWNSTRYLAFELVCGSSLSYYLTYMYYWTRPRALIVHVIDTSRYYGRFLGQVRKWVSFYNVLGGISGYEYRYYYEPIVVKNVTIMMNYWGDLFARLVITGKPSISDVFDYPRRPYGSVVLGERTSHFALLASNYFTATLNHPSWRAWSLLDSFVVNPEVTTVRWDMLPGKVVGSIGGPLLNRLTRFVNPPDRVGLDGIPFFYDSSAGGIRDARTGAIYYGDVFVIAMAYVPTADKYVIVMWGLTGRATYASGVYFMKNSEWLGYRGLVVEWRDFNGNNLPDFNDIYRVLATWQ